MSTPTWQGQTTSQKQTVELGSIVGRFAQAGDVIALVGQLGAGKTQFVRGLATTLNIDTHQVASPTYVLVHEYETDTGPILVHIDAYRLAGPQELQTIGWDADTNGSEIRENAIVAVEWADRLGGALGNDALHIELTHENDDERSVRINASDTWQDRFEQLTAALEPFAKSAPTSPCPICKTSVREDAGQFPFCSKRCRQIDLGKWLKGDYLISRPIEQADLDEE